MVDDSPAESSSTQSLVLPCFVNQLLDPFAWSVNQKWRSNVSSFGGPTALARKRPEDRHAREALAQYNLYSLEVCSRREYVSEANNDVPRRIGVLHHRWNSVQHVRQALAPSAWNFIRSLHLA